MTKFKKGQVSVTRAREMADSLMDKSKRLKDGGYAQLEMGKAAIKNGVGGKKLPADGGDINLLGRTLSGIDRYNIGKKAIKQASADSTKAVRLRANADKAMAAANAKLKAQAGRDKPLPSSDGILSTIKNWFE